MSPVIIVPPLLTIAVLLGISQRESRRLRRWSPTVSEAMRSCGPRRVALETAPLRSKYPSLSNVSTEGKALGAYYV